MSYFNLGVKYQNKIFLFHFIHWAFLMLLKRNGLKVQWFYPAHFECSSTWHKQPDLLTAVHALQLGGKQMFWWVFIIVEQRQEILTSKTSVWDGLGWILFFNKIVLICFYVIIFLYPPWGSPSSTWLFCMPSETHLHPQNCNNLDGVNFVNEDVIIT